LRSKALTSRSLGGAHVRTYVRTRARDRSRGHYFWLYIANSALSRKVFRKLNTRTRFAGHFVC